MIIVPRAATTHTYLPAADTAAAEVFAELLRGGGATTSGGSQTT